MPAAGALAQETVTTAYNTAGLPTTLTGTASYLSGTTYRNDGRVASRTVPIGATATVRSYTYDTPAGRLSRIQSLRGAATVEDVTYGYDSDSNVTSVTDLTAGVGATPQRECFEYTDGLDRLMRAYTTDAACSTPNHTFGADPYDVSYTYNKIGDLTSSIDNMTSTTLNYTYTVPGHAHAAGTIGAGAYTYDQNGATVTRPGPGATTLTWNPLHQLDTAVAGATTTRMVYDADGNRLIRNDGTTAVLYLDGQEIAYTAGGTSATRYYGNAAARDNSNALTALLRNNQNSATTTVDASGTVRHQRYLPYGAHRGTTNTLTATTKGFLDKTEDPTGLNNIGARYYDPAIARFTTIDPIADLSRPQSLAGYTYGLGNPTTLVDPSGLVAVEPGSSTECDNHRCDPPPPTNAVPTAQPQTPPAPPGAKDDVASTSTENNDEEQGGSSPGFYCTTPDTTGRMSCGLGVPGDGHWRLVESIVTAPWDHAKGCWNGKVSSCGWMWLDLFSAGIAARGFVTAAETTGTEVGANSALRQASETAFTAADDVSSWTVKTKHLAGSAGRWAKFAQGIDERQVVEAALRSPNAAFYANPQSVGTFVVRSDLGYTIGTTGETAVRVVVTQTGRIITAFPVK